MLKQFYLLFFALSLPFSAFSQEVLFSDLADLPAARSAVTSASNGEYIFVANGFGPVDQYTDEVFQYNVAENTWSILTDATILKRYASAAIVGDFLYVFNGVTEGGQLNNSVEKISIADGSIEYLSENPQPSRAGGVATWNNKIYSFGGALQPGVYSDKLYEFDPQTDTWTVLSDIPFAGETKGEIVDGKLYILGGYNGTVSDRVDVYDLATDSWEARTLFVPVSAHATAVVGSRIYLVGDFSNLMSIIYFDTVESYVSILSNNLEKRRHCAAESVNGSLFAIGGNTISDIGSAIASVQGTAPITSTEEISNIISFNVYPNPVASRLYLNRVFDELYIYDIQGRVIQRFQEVTDIDLTTLHSGIYFIKGNSEGQMFKAKFMKQ